MALLTPAAVASSSSDGLHSCLQARRIQRKAVEQAAGSGEPEHPGRQTLGTITARRSSARGGLPGAAGGLKRKAGAGWWSKGA